jgi:hypothetical protein
LLTHETRRITTTHTSMTIKLNHYRSSRTDGAIGASYEKFLPG